MKISILIPCFNNEATIARAIESAQGQDYKNLEIVISDNYSEDATPSIIEKYAARDVRIKLVTGEKNRGPYANWVRCLLHSSGDYVHWLFSDDWVEPGFYTEASNRLRSDGSKVVTCWTYRNDYDVDKYISWQYSHPTERGEIAARKVLNQTGELPHSPVAYLLPRDGAFALLRPYWRNWQLQKCEDKGIGIDSIMVISALFRCGKLSVIQKPYVTLTKSERNISTIMHKSGDLMSCYKKFHFIYFLENNIPMVRSDIWTMAEAFLLLKGSSKVMALMWIGYIHRLGALAFLLAAVLTRIRFNLLAIEGRVLLRIFGDIPRRRSTKVFNKD